jgi:hypothetical protein
MPQQNVEVRNEVVRSFFWAFENDTEGFRDRLNPEIECFPIDENRTRVSGIDDCWLHPGYSSRDCQRPASRSLDCRLPATAKGKSRRCCVA